MVPFGNVSMCSRHLLMALFVSSISVDCLHGAVLSATKCIRSVTVQQHEQGPMISCILLIPSGDSFFSLAFL